MTFVLHLPRRCRAARRLGRPNVKGVNMPAALTIALLLPADAPAPLPSADAVEAVDLSRLTPHSPLVGKVGRFVFVPDSLPGEDGDGRVGVDAAGPPGCSRAVLFAPGETDDGL